MAGGLLYGLSGNSRSGIRRRGGVSTSSLCGSYRAIQRGGAAASARAWRAPGVVLEGIRYIWREKLILGAISLDLFAVLLGGAVALLPIYAKDILHAGTTGLGILRAAPGFGAVATAIVVAHRPLTRRAGTTMLACVFGFGVCTIVFGLSRNLALSLGALALLGAFDMVSVIIRHTLVQLGTPDAMRGRVSSVNMVFIGDLQRGRPVRVGHHRGVVRHRSGGDFRRHRHTPGGARVGVDVSRTARSGSAARV